MFVAGFYGVLKPALLAAYRHYLKVTDPLADWPSKKLVEEFVADEERHLREIAPYLKGVDAREWKLHLTQALDDVGGWLGQETRLPLAAGYAWQHEATPYTHPATCNRGKYPVCSSVFGFDPKADPIVRPWLTDPKTDARVIRLMVYVWLMMEMDAVDYLATVFIETPRRRSTCTTTSRATSGTSRGTASLASASCRSSAWTSRPSSTRSTSTTSSSRCRRTSATR